MLWVLCFCSARRSGEGSFGAEVFLQKATWTIVLAVLSIYAVDFAINVGMHGISWWFGRVGSEGC